MKDNIAATMDKGKEKDIVDQFLVDVLDKRIYHMQLIIGI